MTDIHTYADEAVQEQYRQNQILYDTSALMHVMATLHLLTLATCSVVSKDVRRYPARLSCK